MLEELMLVLNEAPQNTEAETPSPAVTETTSQGKFVCFITGELCTDYISFLLFRRESCYVNEELR